MSAFSLAALYPWACRHHQPLSTHSLCDLCFPFCPRPACPTSDLEWKITYVGSAESNQYDQVLDSVLVGPVAVGSYRFVFQADPPNSTLIPQDDVLGVTVILLTCAYNGAEFIRVGYYVNNEYADEALRDNPPAVVQVDRVVRNILADKPRVTRFNIDYGVAQGGATPQISDGGVMADAGMFEYSPEQQQQQMLVQQQQQSAFAYAQAQQQPQDGAAAFGGGGMDMMQQQQPLAMGY